MSFTSDHFGFTISQHGARLIAKEERLSPAILDDATVDLLIAERTAELIGVGAEMKTALRTLRETPFFGGRKA
jgi:hypothetical protein